MYMDIEKNQPSTLEVYYSGTNQEQKKIYIYILTVLLIIQNNHYTHNSILNSSKCHRPNSLINTKNCYRTVDGFVRRKKKTPYYRMVL